MAALTVELLAVRTVWRSVVWKVALMATMMVVLRADLRADCLVDYWAVLLAEN